jgi:hypothetical protein
MKRVLVAQRSNGGYEAMLSEINKEGAEKVLCREENKTEIEAIGMLVLKHASFFGLFEIQKIVSFPQTAQK